jgi:hypothetical protein
MSLFKKNKVDPKSEGEVCRRREAAIKIIEKDLDIANITGLFMGHRERLDKLILCCQTIEKEDSLNFVKSNLHQGHNPASIAKIKQVGEKLKQIV